MKLFPSKKFTAKLRSDYSVAVQNLKANTDITDSLVSERTKKEFRGQVNENGFKLISSEIGRGAVCVLSGEFTDQNGIIEVRIHNAFKIMFSILLSYPLIGFGLIAYNDGFEKALEFLPTLFIGLLVIRFVFIELSFRFISKIGINKLTLILNIIDLKKNEAQQHL